MFKKLNLDLYPLQKNIDNPHLFQAVFGVRLEGNFRVIEKNNSLQRYFREGVFVVVVKEKTILFGFSFSNWDFK